MLSIKFPHFNFIGNRNKGFIFSGFLLLVSIISVIAHKGFNTSVDFSGGTVLQLRFENPISEDLNQIRQIIGDLGYGSPEVRTIGRATDNEISVTVKKRGEGSIIGDQVVTALRDNYENGFEIRRTEQVGPRIGRELFRNTAIGVLLSVTAILIYMGFRFHLPFGVAAVVALVHDILITLGALSLINAEMSLATIAALLTILGYSLNDTIVVFDRVRENLGGSAVRKSFEDKINESLNETLGRTVITSTSTLLALGTILFVFFNNNQTIRDLSFAMTVGTLIGTYSSIFIASSVVIMWNKKRPIK